MKKMSPKDLNRWIGSQIYKMRISRKLSQEALAEAVDVSRVFISQLENGNQAAKIYTYYRIACALDIPFCSLFRENENDGLLEEVLFLLSECSAAEISAYIELLRVVRSLFYTKR